MPGGSSTVLGDTSKMESPVPLLGVAGKAGSMDQQDGVKDKWHSAMHSAPLTAEGACRWKKYCILVWIETARDKKPLQAHAWGEALLKDFFQATIGIPYAIIIISPTECMLFAPGRSKELGMSYKDSRTHCQQLNGIHPWVGSAVEVTALQRMVKEGRYDVARAKQYTHERTKERLTKMHASPTPSPKESPQARHTLPEPARGRRMTWWADGTSFRKPSVTWIYRTGRHLQVPPWGKVICDSRNWPIWFSRHGWPRGGLYQPGRFWQRGWIHRCNGPFWTIPPSQT